MLDEHLLQARDSLMQPYEDLTLELVRDSVGQDDFPEFVRAWTRSLTIILLPQDIDFFVNAELFVNVDLFGLCTPHATHISSFQLCVNTDAFHESLPALERDLPTAMSLVTQMTNLHGCTVFIDVFRPVPGHSILRVTFDGDGLDAASPAAISLPCQTI
ncbi:hypothetical protein NX059_012264 [Plenodomus lindquistii]|nr:hypothetical protein NX059_012264 [Plenodomus lindquistii]